MSPEEALLLIVFVLGAVWYVILGRRVEPWNTPEAKEERKQWIEDQGMWRDQRPK